MLNKFEEGKKYRVKTLEELEQTENVISTPERLFHEDFQYSFILKLPQETFEWNDMLELCNTQFIAEDGDFITLNGYFIEPWMCEEVKINVDNTSQTPLNLTKVVKHNEICKNLNALYKSKNNDYGDSFGETFKKLGVISAITRITDKVNRLQSIATKEQLVNDESIKDTLMDLANYSIMTIIELEGEKE